MKAVKTIERKYYKYSYQSWTQPTLTANGTMGGSSFAVSSNVTQYSGADVWCAFDGITSSGLFHSLQGVTTGYIDMYNPNPLKITLITIYNQNNPSSYNRASSAGKIYGSNNGANWTQIITYTNAVQGMGETWTIDLSSNQNYYKYYRMESTAGSSGGYWTIAEVKLTAQVQIAIEGSSQDYDFYEDVEEYKVQQEVVRTYYKYSYVDWTQPTLTGDTTSTSLGNIVVTCSSYATHDNYHPYLAMNNNWGGGSGGCWASNYVTSAWWKVVFPYNIKITNIDFQGRQTSESKIYTSEGGTLLGTVSSTTRTNIPVDNVVTNTLYVTVQGNSTVGIIEMRLTATRISGSQESTEEDYDYYIDTTECRAFKF